MSDDKFEQLLARSARRQTPPPGSCPDAGELAALLDGSLDTSERQHLERHVADCSRCALHLATLSRLEEAAGEHADAGGSAWWRQWQWAVPLATLVLAVAVWIGVPRDIDEPRPGEAPAAAVDEQDHVAADRSETRADAGRAEPAEEDRADAARGGARNARRGAAPVGQTAPSRAKEETPAVADDKQIAPAPQRFKSDRELERAEPLADARQEARFRTSPDQSPSSLAAEKAQQPPPPAGVTAAAPAAGEAASRRAAGQAPLAQLAAALVVSSPDPAVRWRVQEGRIERTIDEGGTWQPDHDETVGGLRVGAAPSADVCWLAGAGGVVLRREPSGGWRLVPLPVAVDIRALTSSSALEAAVTLVDGRRLQTADGGRTWK